MKPARTFSAAAVVGALALGGCNGTTLLTLEDLAGTWVASSLLFSAQADNTIQVELIQVGGQFQIELMASGNYTTTLTEPGSNTPEVDNGTITLTNASEFGATVTLTDTGSAETDTFTLEKIGNTITMSGAGMFEFPGTGVQVPVNITVVLTRQ